MDSDVTTERRKLALLQHERVMQEADFVAQLSRQARNRATSQPIHAQPQLQPAAVRSRVRYQLVG